MTRDGRQIAAEFGPQLDFLSRVSRKVGVADLVEDFFDPVVGDWNDLREEAERWRKAAGVTEAVTKHVMGPLGTVDAAWQGKDAETFVEHMRKSGLAGADMSDAMNAMAEALDETADTVRDIVKDMGHVLADAADSVSGAASLPLDGDAAVVKHLEELRAPVRELFDSVRDVLEAFLRLCDGVSGEDGNFSAVTMKHRYPDQNWSYTPPAAPKGPEPAPEKPSEKPSEKPAEPAKTAPAGAGGGGGASGGGSSMSGSLDGGPAEKDKQMQFGGATMVQEPKPSEPGAGGGGARPAAAAAGAAPAGGTGGAMMGGMAPMMGGGAMGGQQGGDTEHKRKQKLTGSVEDLLGKPKKASPKTIGED